MSDASRVIVSGDVCRPDSPILRDPNTEWAAGRAVDVVVTESTYGARERHGRSECPAPAKAREELPSLAGQARSSTISATTL